MVAHTCTPLVQKAEASLDEGWLGPQDNILFPAIPTLAPV